MALQWIEGFDHYGTGTTGQANMLAGPWAQLTNGVTTTVQPTTAAARTGTGSLRINPHNANTEVRRAFNGSLNDVIIGFAFNLDNLPLANSFMLASFASSGGTQRFSVNINTVGGLDTYTGNWNSGTFIEESGPVITPLGWYFIEIKVHHSTTGGSYTIRINNKVVMSKTSVNTGSESAQFIIDSAGSAVLTPAAGFYIDDMYCADITGGVNNDFIGDARVYTLFPDGDSGTAQWVPNSGSSLYTRVNETIQDGDTSYNQGTTAGDIYTVTYADLPTNVVNVYGLQSSVMAKKTDAGTAGLTQSFDSSGTIQDGTNKAITTNYVYWRDISEVDPNVSGSWTRTSVNAVKIRQTQTN